MEDKKKKTMPLPINIGSATFGIGGIVLFAGALVAATIVSAFAIKTTRKKNRSSSVDAPNELELIIKTNKDRESSKDFSLHLQNSSDGITDAKEMQTKPVQNLIPDEKQNFGIFNNEKLDFDDDGEDKESPVFERADLNNGYEETPVEDSEEQVVEASSEEESPSVMGAAKVDGGEEQKNRMQIDDEQTDTSTEKQSVSSEAFVLIEEGQVIDGVCDEDLAAVEEEESIRYDKAKDTTVDDAPAEVLLRDDIVQVAQADDDEKEEEMAIGHAGEENEAVFMNEEEAAACVHQIEVEDNPQVQFFKKDFPDEMVLENSEEDLINETGFAGEDNERAFMNKEEETTASVPQIEVEDNHQVQHFKTDGQDEMVVGNSEEANERGFLDEIVSEGVTGGEEASYAACVHVEEGRQVQFLEEKDCHDEMILENCEKEPSKETGCADEEEATEAACVEGISVQTQVIEDNPPREVMDEEEEEEEEEEETAHEIQVEMITEDVELIEEAKDDDDQTELREDNPPRQFVNEETVEPVEVKIKVKEDEVPHVQLTEEAKDDEEDAIWADESMPEPERNKSSHKIEQEIQNDVDVSEIMNEDTKNGERFVKGRKASELKLQTWAVLLSIWCLCHWHSQLPFPQLSLVASFFFVIILLAIRNRNRNHLVKYE